MYIPINGAEFAPKKVHMLREGVRPCSLKAEPWVKGKGELASPRADNRVCEVLFGETMPS